MPKKNDSKPELVSRRVVLPLFFTMLGSAAIAACTGVSSGDNGAPPWSNTAGMSDIEKDKVADTLALVLVSYARELEAAPDIVESIQRTDEDLMSKLTKYIAALNASTSAQASVEDIDALRTRITLYNSIIQRQDDMLSDALNGEGRVRRFDAAIQQSPCLNRQQTPSCVALSAAIVRYDKVRTIAIQNTGKAIRFLQATSARKEAISKVVKSYGGTLENPTGRK
jgi:hypothetical protein